MKRSFFFAHRSFLHFSFILVLCSMFFFACKKDKDSEEIDLGKDYFPTKLEHYIIYDCDSTYYFDHINDTFDITETVHFRLLSVIESEFYDDEGRLTQRVEHYKKYLDPNVPYDQQEWHIAEVQTINVTASMAITKEGNESFARLIFPPKVGRRWNGNILNYQDSWSYEYTSLALPFTGLLTFQNTLTVRQTGLNDPIIHTEIGTEVYAKDIGLVHKEFTFLVRQPDTTGSHYIMRAIDYKK